MIGARGSQHVGQGAYTYRSVYGLRPRLWLLIYINAQFEYRDTTAECCISIVKKKDAQGSFNIVYCLIRINSASQ